MIIVLWLVLIGIIAGPVVMNFTSGVEQSETLSIIERESEASNVRITAREEHGNKAMYCFAADSCFGVAIFDHYADNYSYSEGTISNGESYIAVRLDTGCDVYRYNITADGAQLTGMENFKGIYRLYAAGAGILVLITAAYVVYGKVMRRKGEIRWKKI